MTAQGTVPAPVNGAALTQELFALTDEQILEIGPVGQDVEAITENAALHTADRTEKADPSTSPAANAASARDDKQITGGQAEPPAWLARQMKDPWAGEEARELWEGVQRAQAEAAEYRSAIATPAEAKSLKEIYPGGVEQARATAERARMLDEFDAAYFGKQGSAREEVSAARTALAQRMLREDPAAFQEMVAAGIKVIEEAKKQGSGDVATRSSATPTAQQEGGLKSAATQSRPAAEHNAHLAAYSDFEKAANVDLEKSVGGAIERALRQALPNAKNAEGDALTARLSASVRQEIEKALQGDRQLGEQVAQVLSSRRFDDTARTQVVRLINERAQQLVPSATKRVLNDWTQTTLAAHRSKTEKQEAASSRADLAPAQQGRERPATGNQQRTPGRTDAPPPRGRIDYKKLSDEQILEL